jgi:hypothetical protein
VIFEFDGFCWATLEKWLNYLGFHLVFIAIVIAIEVIFVTMSLFLRKDSIELHYLILYKTAYNK